MFGFMFRFFYINSNAGFLEQYGVTWQGDFDVRWQDSTPVTWQWQEAA